MNLCTCWTCSATSFPYLLRIRLTLTLSSLSYACKVRRPLGERTYLNFKQQNWAQLQHGICGRGVLLDLVEFYTSTGSPYDPISTHAIIVADLEACAQKEGVQFRQGDVLILRMGFIQKHVPKSVGQE